MDKIIKGFENYSVDESGNVFSFGKKTRKGKRKLKPSKLKNAGYLAVDLCKDGHVFRKTLHRLVAIAFLPNENNFDVVNHKNGVKTDNRVENLEWCTHSQNQLHSIQAGLRSAKGVKNSQCKLKENDVLDIRSSEASLKDLASKYSISLSTIYDIKKKRSWTHI